MNRTIAILLAVILISSCSNNSNSGEGTTTTKELFSMENPASFFLNLVDKTEGDTSISYVAKGLYQDDTVGVIIEVNKNIPAGVNNDGSVNNEEGFKKGTIKFKKLGAESDRFVSALAKLWQIEGIDKMKTEPIEPLTFLSNKKPIDLNKASTSSFKLFFDEDSPDPGEIFFTFDTYKQTAEFQEKEIQHRATIAHAFAE
ncbi:hypothetical protein H8S90_14555 [Olivibacter sp. SDN3]|uniref:hypothetical protein n=1 Tax=Olivibacter sp. SDN3 TaxID=2764720 RepID=UPI001651A7FF|nr:hypothetical protein [Olivibacter sp. SDN3]QNL48028.1 hypothetical protein H8S90_14555 [Olivibacter sp. SDN3]